MTGLKYIAYLAPEIPSVSATFVYNEILKIQEKGINVVPISIHKINNVVRDSKVEELAQKTFYLYKRNLLSALVNSVWFVLIKPKNYLNTFFMVLGDIISSGLNKLSSWKLLYQFLYASLVAKELLDNSCQYLHVHFAHVPTQIGMYASSLAGIPFSFTSHANDIFENKLLLKEKVERAKAAITISEYNYSYLSNLGADISKLKVVRCGIDTSKYVLKNQTSIKHIPKIGSLGRLIEKKGMDDLILALSKLNNKGIDFQLEIGGDGLLQTYLKELADVNGIGSKTKFKGAIPNDEVYDWLRSLDLFVLACKEDTGGDRDGIPVVLMEAMSIGIPVIATNISGIPELIQDQKSGLLAQPDNPESLANAIETLHGSHSIAEITQTARNTIEREFELNSNVEQLLAVFNNQH